MNAAEGHPARVITLKAFANSSPGLLLATPGKRISFLEGTTLKELGRHSVKSKTAQRFQRSLIHGGPKRRRYSVDLIKAFTMSALTKLPLNSFSLFSQKLYPARLLSGGSLGFLRR